MERLPLWLTGVLAPVLPVLLSAYLNQRLFRYDALADHASADEYHVIINASRGRMYVLGGLLALLYYVPLLNLFAPVKPFHWQWSSPVRNTNPG